MAASPSLDDTRNLIAGNLIAGTYGVDVARPLAGAGGGLPAFAVTDRLAGRSGLMAVQSTPGAPPRAMALNALAGWSEDGLLAPLAHGPGQGARGEAAWFVVSAAPPGPSLAAALRPWSEPELLEFVLRPAAAVLAALDLHRVTHRAIRIDNIFRNGTAAPVVLGTAWSAPPALHQPALFEPPYSAMCLPSGRGDGTIADDVYALGVTLVVLALGRLPLEGLDPVAILRRKLSLGSYAALVGDERLPPAIGDLVRGMLAEDPEHRPPPMLLADPAAARARRVAARPPRRGQRPLELSGERVWDVRTLAHAVATDPDEGGRLLRSGTMDRWLRRNLGDPTMAARLEEVTRLHDADGLADSARADALMTMRAVAILDPLAPLCWRGVALWPDGLGPALASAHAMGGDAGDLLTERLGNMVACEAAGHWAMMRPERCDAIAVRLLARQRRVMVHLRGWGGGLARLRYALNPLLACASPIVAGRMVARLHDLLAALEAAAARPELRRGQPVDREIAAFVAARNDQRFEAELVGMADNTAPEQAVLMQLRMLAGLQRRVDGRAVPGLAGWLAEQAAPTLAAWRNRPRREALERAVGEVARSGQLSPMAGLLDNGAARAADTRGFKAAGEAVQRIDAEIAALAAAAPARAEAARQIGHEVALGIAMMAVTVAVVAAVLA
jgi:hypothetical protein